MYQYTYCVFHSPDTPCTVMCFAISMYQYCNELVWLAILLVDFLVLSVRVWYMQYWPRTGLCRQAMGESSPPSPGHPSMHM